LLPVFPCCSLKAMVTMGTKHLIITGNVMDDITRLASEDLPLQIFQPFKGMVLTQTIKILEVGQGYVTLQAPRQEISYVLSDFIFLHSHDFSQTITARLEKINLTAGRMTISNLKYTEVCWHDRASERVQPKNPILVTIRAGKSIFQAFIEDISLTGIGILGYKIIEKGISLQPADTTTLIIKLPPWQSRLVVHGTVANIHSYKNGMVRIGEQFYPSEAIKPGIKAYIDLRKKELNDELKLFTPEQLETCGSVHLYF